MSRKPKMGWYTISKWLHSRQRDAELPLHIVFTEIDNLARHIARLLRGEAQKTRVCTRPFLCLRDTSSNLCCQPFKTLQQHDRLHVASRSSNVAQCYTAATRQAARQANQYATCDGSRVLLGLGTRQCDSAAGKSCFIHTCLVYEVV